MSTSQFKKTVLITGATGVLGRSVLEAFATAGWTTRVLVRTPPALVPWTASPAVVCGSITDEALVTKALEGVDVVVHLAAKLHLSTPTESDIEEYQSVNVDGTSTIVRVARRKGTRIVAASTIAVYGPTDGRFVDERTVPNPVTPYALSKLKAERIVLSARSDDGNPIGTVLRLGAVYGPRMKGNYRRLALAQARGWLIPVGALKNRRSLIYEDDAATAFLLAAQQPRCANRVYNVTDGRAHEMREILDAIGLALHRRAPRWSLPVGPVRALATTSDVVLRLVGSGQPRVTAMVEKWLEDLAVESVDIQSELGFRPAVSLSEGWRLAVTALLNVDERRAFC